MCRNIKTLFNFNPPATDDEIQASALQFVRKLSGSTKASAANQEVFDRAVVKVADVARELVDSLVTQAPPRDREVEAERSGFGELLQGPAVAQAARRVLRGRRDQRAPRRTEDACVPGEELHRQGADGRIRRRHLPARVGSHPREQWSRRAGSNRGPADYESAGVVGSCPLRTRPLGGLWEVVAEADYLVDRRPSVGGYLRPAQIEHPRKSLPTKYLRCCPSTRIDNLPERATAMRQIAFSRNCPVVPGVSSKARSESRLRSKPHRGGTCG